MSDRRSDHGLSFETAQLVFDDPFALSQPDPHPDGERWRTVGVVGTVVLFVVHTWPEPDAATEKRSAGSSAPGKQPCTKRKPMRKGSSKLTAAQKAEIDALAAMPEDQINTKAVPEQRDRSNAKRGAFFRPVKSN